MSKISRLDNHGNRFTCDIVNVGNVDLLVRNQTLGHVDRFDLEVLLREYFRHHLRPCLTLNGLKDIAWLGH